MEDLNGRPAQKFTWTISERQFQVELETDSGPRLIALSSSWSTFEKCVSEMYSIGSGQKKSFNLVEQQSEPDKPFTVN